MSRYRFDINKNHVSIVLRTPNTYKIVHLKTGIQKARFSNDNMSVNKVKEWKFNYWLPLSKYLPFACQLGKQEQGCLSSVSCLLYVYVSQSLACTSMQTQMQAHEYHIEIFNSVTFCFNMIFISIFTAVLWSTVHMYINNIKRNVSENWQFLSISLLLEAVSQCW